MRPDENAFNGLTSARRGAATFLTTGAARATRVAMLAGLLTHTTAKIEARADEAAPSRDTYTRNVAIVIWNGAEVLDWAGPSEVFEAASRFGRSSNGPAFNVYTVSKTKEAIRSQRFVEVTPNYSIADAPRPDIIVLPGGGTSSVLRDPEFLEWAGTAAQGSEVALSVCTGAFILATAGLLDDKEATTWYGALQSFEERFPKTQVRRGRRFVDNGQVVTTAGVSAGIDGSLHVVARLLGRHVADRTAQYMEYRWTPEPYLAREYRTLNPSLDARGRRAQQADIHQLENNRAAAAAIYEELLAETPHDARLWHSLAGAYRGMEQHARAGDAFSKAAVSDELARQANYNAACSYALAGNTEQALEHLSRAIEAGFDDDAYLRSDPDLASLHANERFTALLKRITPSSAARATP